MIYRKRPPTNIRFTYPGAAQNSNYTPEYHEENLPQELKDIPLPNLNPESPCHISSRKWHKSASPLQILHNFIGIEEIILLGTIFLLIEESIEDEILLIILIYLLLAGFERN
ncbi:MAG TPA: hypothetical protein PK566_02005 [Pseudobacteroides sp.]|nr:hypothetical protein [Pseudobacteroides sp.]